MVKHALKHPEKQAAARLRQRQRRHEAREATRLEREARAAAREAIRRAEREAHREARRQCQLHLDIMLQAGVVGSRAWPNFRQEVRRTRGLGGVESINSILDLVTNGPTKGLAIMLIKLLRFEQLLAHLVKHS